MNKAEIRCGGFSWCILLVRGTETVERYNSIWAPVAVADVPADTMRLLREALVDDIALGPRE